MEFDGQFVRRCAPVRKLMDEFVRVRIAGVNGLDLSLFQFDWDLTFTVFFLNADGTIYGRFGTRSHMREAERDISFEGLRKAMEAALELHRAFPESKAALAGKKGVKPRFPTPDDYPWVKDRGLGKHCMSCHFVLNAERMYARTEGKPVSDELLFPWPMPSTIGLELDPKAMARVTKVASGSPADGAGFEKGDEILALGGQPILSIADVQWVLTRAAESAKVEARVARGKGEVNLTLALPAGWRRESDISWRTSTWFMRGQVLGSMRLVDLPDGERRKRGLSAKGMAFGLARAPRWNSEAGRAGFRGNDVIVAYGAAKERMSEGRLLAWAMRSTKPGDVVPVTVLRSRKRVPMKLTVK
ncbi:MAG: Trx7/PDZ domain-containing (seleno)protein [Planctomycetota bacterium]|jgi:hypothetical protein